MLEQYIGTKIINAVRSDRVDKEGYRVVYDNPDGSQYTSWSPLDVFENSYRRTDNMSFGLALDAVKLGASVARRGWSDWGGKDQFVYMIRAQEIQSAFGYGYGEYMGEPKFTSCLAIHTQSRELQVGWVPSQKDMMLDDWFIVNKSFNSVIND